MKAEKLIADFNTKGWNLDIYEQLFELAANSPSDVYEFASLFIDKFDKSIPYLTTR